MASPKAIAASGVAAGAFLQGDGTPVALGYLMLQLNAPVGSLTGGGEVAALPAKKISLDANGVPASGQTLFASDQFSSPVNPAYRVRLHNANDLMIGDLGNCVISGAAPVDLTTLVASSNGVSYSGAVLLNPGANQTIASGDLAITNNETVGGTLGVAGTSSLAGVTATSVKLNNAATGTGAALTVGGTTATTGGISVFVGASGAQNEMLSVVPADGSTASARVPSLSVRIRSAGFLTGSEVAKIDTAGAATVTNVTTPTVTQTAATAFILKDNQGGTRFSIPSGGVAASTLNNTDITGGSTLSGTIAYNRLRANRGSAIVTGDVSGITNFGTTATCSAVSGTDGAGTISISSSGTGQVANGSFTFTFHDGAWAVAPVVIASRGDGNGPGSASVGCTASTTAISFSFNGVPVAGSTYIFNFACFGK